MTEFDLWADENKPALKLSGRTYNLKVDGTSRPKGNFTSLFVTVEPYGMVEVEKHSYYMNKHFGSMDFSERMEVYEYLTEWEFAVWRKIGPEDSELFATTKLDEEFGVE